MNEYCSRLKLIASLGCFRRRPSGHHLDPSQCTEHQPDHHSFDRAAATLGYTIYRRHVFIALALNVAILGFLLSAGRSLNLWDYVIDPVAWLLAIGSWAAIAINLLRRKLVATPSRLAAPQPS